MKKVNVFDKLHRVAAGSLMGLTAIGMLVIAAQGVGYLAVVRPMKKEETILHAQEKMTEQQVIKERELLETQREAEQKL